MKIGCKLGVKKKTKGRKLTRVSRRLACILVIANYKLNSRVLGGVKLAARVEVATGQSSVIDVGRCFSVRQRALI